MGTVCLNIQGVPKDYPNLPFGRQLEYQSIIDEFKRIAKRIHFSCKRMTTRKGIQEFRRLYKPTEWYFIDRDGPRYHDDSVEIWYRN